MTRDEALAAICAAAMLLGDELGYQEEGTRVAEALDGLDDLDAFIRSGGVFDDGPEPSTGTGSVHGECADGAQAVDGALA